MYERSHIMSSVYDQTLRWPLFSYDPQQRNVNHFDNATHHSSVPKFPQFMNF
jgi:hypothetical protein